MNPDLKQLIRLQGIDLSIQEIRTSIDKFPGISKALDAKLASARAALAEANDRAKTVQASRKKSESEVATLEAKVSKYREQMMSVKTNVEYKALQTEIEHTQNAIRQLEDNILAMMMEAESVQEDIKTAETRLKEDQTVVDRERKALEEENRKEMSALESCIQERKEIESSVSSDILPRYERVRKARSGIAVSPARDYVCEVCQVRIRPQVFQEIRKNDKIIACDACQRILYDPENLDHPFEVV